MVRSLVADLMLLTEVEEDVWLTTTAKKVRDLVLKKPEPLRMDELFQLASIL